LHLVLPPELFPRAARLFSFRRSVLVAGVVMGLAICLGAFHRIAFRVPATVDVGELPVLVAESVAGELPSREESSASRPERGEEVPPPAPRQSAAAMILTFGRPEFPVTDAEPTDGEPIDSLVLRDDPVERLFPPEAKPKRETPAKRQPRATADPSRSRVASVRSTVRKAATLLRRVPPAYPARARRAGVEGRVLLAVAVRSDGKVDAVSLVRSSGSGLLDSAAMRAVRKWSFHPATLNGRAVHSELRVPVRFELR
jgi:protein TonB